MWSLKDILSLNLGTNDPSFIYVLLLSNVLSLSVFLEDRSNIKQNCSMVIKENKNTKPVPKIVYSANENKLNTTNLSKVKAVNNREKKQEQESNIIDFNQVMVKKPQEAEEPLKTLVWRFPN